MVNFDQRDVRDHSGFVQVSDTFWRPGRARNWNQWEWLAQPLQIDLVESWYACMKLLLLHRLPDHLLSDLFHLLMLPSRTGVLLPAEEEHHARWHIYVRMCYETLVFHSGVGSIRVKSIQFEVCRTSWLLGLI